MLRLLVRIKLLNYLLTSALSFLIVLGNVFPVNAGENALSSEVVSIKGELRKWHKVTLEVAGPEASEGGTLNPFLDIRLDVTFRQGQKEYVVPGYYAADGKAGESSASDGNVWKVHFAPDATGRWEYSVSFRKGSGIAVNGASGTSLSGDGASGSFTVGESNKQAPDNRARGRLEYVGERYLRYAETGEYFIKGGPDAPENFLAYADFDGTQNNDGISDELIKSWSAHKQDWRSGDASWQGGKGKGMIGALNYLAGQGLNVFSFLTLNILGDDKNVFPYVKYNGKLSGSPVEDRLRFDVSKLAQWEAVFEYAETLGMFLHIKLQETEVDELLDGGKLGVERKLYYREMIARFGHHLALNWNLGEEHMLYFKIGDKENKYLQQYGEYFYEQDPYHHHLVVHTRPDRKYKVYPYLLGDQSKLTGFSLQSYYSNVHADTRYWLSESEKAGRVWVTSNDEQGPAGDGLLPDGPGNNYDAIRKNVLWGNLMAGGSGCEFYFGYEHAQSDLSCEDWRSRSGFWGYVGHALSFFRDHVPYWEMAGADGLVGGGGNSNEKYCLAKEGEVYVVYLSNGGSTSIDLQEGSYTVKWYNPRKGGQLVEGSVKTITGSGVNIGTPPTEANQDWVALLERSGDVEMNISKFVLYDTESNSILADPLEDGAVIQADEKVSVVAVSEPTVVGSVQFKVNGQEAHVSNSMPYAIAGHSGGGSAAGAVEEEDGIALWEAESIPVQGEWKLEQQVKGYSGNGYYNWKGADYFKKPGNGILRYKVKVSKAGNYQFLFRTKNTFEISGEHNDSWVQLPSGENVAGEEPLNKDWVKVFQSQHRKWSWQARTVDHVDRPIRVYLEAGVHEVLLSGRSHGHAIDRIALFRYEEVNFSEDKFDGLPNSKQVGGEQVLHAWPLTIGTHSITATPFTGKNADGSKGEGTTIAITVVDKNSAVIPVAPQKLQASSEENVVHLSWDDTSDNEDGFEIERKEDEHSFELISTVKSNITSFTDKTSEYGKEYHYRVRAVNTLGKSGYSNEINIKLVRPANVLPTASFSVDKKSGFLPLIVNFNASDAFDADGKIMEYAWDFGDGNEETGKITEHTFGQEGIFDVILSVTDDRGGVHSITKKITVLSKEEYEGNTYYVSSSEGSDDNEGTSANQPWKTLQKVNSTTFSPGDTILFKRGDSWPESLIIPTSGAANGYITFAVYGQGERPVFAPRHTAEAIRIDAKSYVLVKGIHIKAEAHEKGIRIAGDAAYVIINNCLVEGHGSNTSTRGIEFSAISDGKYPTFPTIMHCEVFNFREGIGGYAGLHEGGTITENYVHTTTVQGTDLIRAISGDYEGLVIGKNELTNWKDDAIDLYGASNVIVEHNQIYAPAESLSKNGSGIGIKAGGVGPPQSAGNIIRYNKIHDLNGTENGLYDGINTNNGNHGKIYGNLIYGVQGNAITVTGGHDFWKIYHNSTINAGKSGIYIGDNVVNIELVNNILDGQKYDIEINGTHAVVNGYFNVLVNRKGLESSVDGEGGYQSETDINHAFSSTPLFVDEGNYDFRLAKNAVAIDAGMSLDNYQHDILEKNIKTLPDIGAYEYHGDEETVLNPPFDLRASAMENVQVKLVWSDVNQHVQYVIERMTVTDTDFSIIDTSSVTNYVDVHVQPDIKYFYRVKAVKSSFSSGYSEIADIKLEKVTEPADNQPPMASFIADIMNGTFPLTVNFNASGSTDQDGEITGFYWDFGDGTTNTGQQLTHTFEDAGEFTVTLTVNDDKDSTDTASKVISVTVPENQLPIADAGSDRTITYPVDNIKLFGRGSDPDGEIVAYAWEQVSGPKQAVIMNPGDSVVEVSQLTPGEYLFQLTIEDDREGKATDEVRVIVEEEVRVNALPVAYAGEDRTITLPADTIVLAGTGTDADGAIITYQWSYLGTDELKLEGENSTSLVVSYLTPGVHTFQLEVTDNDGGSAVDAIEVIVEARSEIISVNKAFSPNGDGIDDVWIIENIEAIEECELTIFNRAGQRVFEAAPYHNNWDATINGRPLPSTDYYYVIQCNGKKVKSGGIRIFR